MAGTGAARFAIASKTCGATLAAGASCVVNVTFHPIGAGASTATVHVADDALGNPHDGNLTGTATVPGVQATPASLSFGSQQDGTLGTTKHGHDQEHRHGAAQGGHALDRAEPTPAASSSRPARAAMPAPARR